MSVNVPLPDEIIAAVDRTSPDRAAFVLEAVRKLLLQNEQLQSSEELKRINDNAAALNEEAEDVLVFQALR